MSCWLWCSNASISARGRARDDGPVVALTKRDPVQTQVDEDGGLVPRVVPAWLPTALDRDYAFLHSSKIASPRACNAGRMRITAKSASPSALSQPIHRRPR